MHIDTPISVTRIEQRIGRLDRLGRTPDRPVRSLLLVGPSETERALHSIYQSVFGVFTGSVGGLEFALPRLQRRIRQALGGGESSEQVKVWLGAEVDNILADVDDDFDLSLDSSKLAIQESCEQADLICSLPRSIWTYLCHCDGPLDCVHVCAYERIAAAQVVVQETERRAYGERM